LVWVTLKGQTNLHFPYGYDMPMMNILFKSFIGSLGRKYVSSRQLRRRVSAGGVMVTLTHSMQKIMTALQTTERENEDFVLVMGGTRWRSWLRHYATSRKVSGPSPDEVNFLNLPNPCSSTMTLGSTQPLTGTSTRNLPGE
jgi:hypothetical protein